jgi:hypothetical protein
MGRVWLLVDLSINSKLPGRSPNSQDDEGAVWNTLWYLYLFNVSLFSP